MSVRNVACSDGTFHAGVHFPLMVRTHNVGTRSKEAEDRRMGERKGTRRDDKKKFTTKMHTLEVCRYCGEEGHKVSECEKIDKEWEATSCHRCWKCGQPGHYAKDCAAARERDAERRRQKMAKGTAPEICGLEGQAVHQKTSQHRYSWKHNAWTWDRPVQQERHAQFYSYTTKYGHDSQGYYD